MQINNEYTYSKHHTIETIKDNMMPLEEHVHAYTSALIKYFAVYDFTYQLKDGTEKIYHTKQQRYEDMQDMSYEELHELAWVIVIQATVKKQSTFTEVLGKFYKRLPHEDRLGLETASEMLGVLNTTPFIDVIYPRNTEEGVLMIQSNIDHDAEILKYLENQRYILPSLVPPKEITTNTETGYQTLTGSIMTKGKHHELPMNLTHLNRQNAIPLTMDERVYRLSEPVFKEEDGEEDKDRMKRLTAWKQLNHECIDIYKKFVGAVFYLTNKYDERARFYTQGHHLNVQGDDYRKGAIEFAEPELIRS